MNTPLIPSNEDLPKSQKEAIKIGSRYYYTGPCAKGHQVPRFTDGRECLACARRTGRIHHRVYVKSRGFISPKKDSTVHTIKIKKRRVAAVNKILTDDYDGPINNRQPEFLTVERYKDVNIINQQFGDKMNTSEQLVFHNQQELDTYNRIQLEYWAPIKAEQHQIELARQEGVLKRRAQAELTAKLLGE